MSEGMQGQQGCQDTAEVSIVDYAVSVKIRFPAVENEDLGAVQQLVTRGVMEQIRELVRQEMQLRKCEDGNVEARVEFYAVPRNAMENLIKDR